MRGREKEPFLEGQIGQLVTQNIFIIEPPNAVGGKKAVPGNKNEHHEKNGRENHFPFAVKSHFFIEAQRKGTGKGCEIQYKV